MAEDTAQLTGPDFEKGIRIDDVADGSMLLGHAFGEAVLVARRGTELFAIGATCTHYGGPLAKGLMVNCTVLPVAPRAFPEAVTGPNTS
jgi:apoptosis-inducing factor 3